MTKFIQKNKLGKKQRKELDKQKRVMWDFPPTQRIITDKKKYNRKKIRINPYDGNTDFSLYVKNYI